MAKTVRFIATLFQWVLVLSVAFAQCSALVYPRKPLVPPGGVHLYLEDEPTNVIEFGPVPPVKIYPLSPEEYRQFKKLLQHKKHPHPKPSPGKKGQHKWASGGGFYEGQKPVLRPRPGYPTNQVQKHSYSQVKPVVEHIEGDLKYDFRTKTHWF